MQYDYCRNIINRIMVMLALGALAGVFFLGSIALFVGGFHICNMGYREGAIAAWVISAIMLIAAIFTLIIFRREYHVQKKIENLEDYTRRTGMLK